MTNKYAYVSVLYGDSIYFIGALVLGWSLKRVTNLTKIDIVILCTPDVPILQKNILSKIFTRVVEIEYFVYNTVASNVKPRFKNVFTKLKCLLLEEYEKIILMDIDMCILKSLDDMYELNAPAGSLINGGNELEIQHGDPIPKSKIVDNNGKHNNSVNAGVLLLKPSKIEYDNIIEDLTNNPEKLNYTAPEQDYLSIRWAGTWTSISFYYNYQFGISGRIRRNNLNNRDEIKCLHYSSSIKPWNILTTDFKTVKQEIKKRRWPIYPYYIWLDEYNNIKKKIKKKYNVDISKSYTP